MGVPAASGPHRPTAAWPCSPCAKTKIERLAKGEPRPLLEKRDGDHRGFVDTAGGASEQLMRRRFLSERDARLIVEMAEASNILR